MEKCKSKQHAGKKKKTKRKERQSEKKNGSRKSWERRDRQEETQQVTWSLLLFAPPFVLDA